jgi:peptidase E
MKLLLISNSTNAGEPYLAWPQQFIKDFCLKHQVRKVLFVPYAGVKPCRIRSRGFLRPLRGTCSRSV